MKNQALKVGTDKLEERRMLLLAELKQLRDEIEGPVYYDRGKMIISCIDDVKRKLGRIEGFLQGELFSNSDGSPRPSLAEYEPCIEKKERQKRTWLWK